MKELTEEQKKIVEAVKVGDDRAIVDLAELIEEGTIDAEYAKYLGKAAENGNFHAIRMLVDLIEEGIIKAKFAKYIGKSVEKDGKEWTIMGLAALIERGIIGAKYAEYIGRASENNDPLIARLAMMALSSLIKEGNIDADDVVEYVAKAAEQGNMAAIGLLGDLIQNGTIDEDYLEYLGKAAKGNGYALNSLTNFIMDRGMGVKYVGYLVEAAEGGDDKTMKNLYRLILEGTIDKKYGEIFVEAAKGGNMTAINNLYGLISKGRIDRKHVEIIVEAAKGGNETASGNLYALINESKVDKEYIDISLISSIIENEKLSIYVNKFDGDDFRKILKSSKTLSDQKNPEFEKFISIIPDRGLYSKRTPHTLSNFIDFLNEGLPLFEVICLNSKIPPEQLSKDSTDDFEKHIEDLLGTDLNQVIKEANKKINIYVQKTVTDKFDLTEEQANQLVNEHGKLKTEHKVNIGIFNKLREHWDAHPERDEKHYTRLGILGKIFCSVLSKDHEIKKTREKYFHSEKDGFYNFKFSELEKLEREHGLTSKEAKRWKEHIRLIRKPKEEIFNTSALISAMNEVKLHVDKESAKKLLNIFVEIENNLQTEEPEQIKEFSNYYRNLKTKINNAIIQIKEESEKEENKEIKAQLVEIKIKFEHIQDQIPDKAENNYWLTITDHLTLEQNMRMGEYPSPNCHHWNAKPEDSSYEYNKTLASFVADATKRTIYVSRKKEVLGIGFLYLVKDKKDGKWRTALDSVAGSTEAQKYVRELAYLKAQRLFGIRETLVSVRLVFGLENIRFESWGKVPELYSDSTGHQKQTELPY
jgi:hypothetical protein